MTTLVSPEMLQRLANVAVALGAVEQGAIVSFMDVLVALEKKFPPEKPNELGEYYADLYTWSNKLIFNELQWLKAATTFEPPRDFEKRKRELEAELNRRGVNRQDPPSGS